MKTKEQYEIEKSLYETGGKLDYFLVVFGDYLAEREGYSEVDGIEAIHFYLIQTHHWLPRDVRAMSFEDIRFVLSEEMAGWTAPVEAR